MSPQSLCTLLAPNKKTQDERMTMERMSYILGGGFKYFLFSPLCGEMIHFDEYLSNGLVQPPTSIFLLEM